LVQIEHPISVDPDPRVFRQERLNQEPSYHTNPPAVRTDEDGARSAGLRLQGQMRVAGAGGSGSRRARSVGAWVWVSSTATSPLTSGPHH
jgi:hypothetical protein